MLNHRFDKWRTCAWISVCLGSGVLAPIGVLNAAERVLLSDDLEIRSLQPGVFLVIHRFPSGCNSLIIQCSERDFVWVDTPCTDDATRQVHEWLKANYADPNVVQINTGFHNDNLGGNAYLIAQGIPCYGSDLTPKLIAECWEQTKQKVLPYYVQAGDEYRDAFISQKLVAPNKLYPLTEGLTLRVGAESVEVHFPGASHTPDNVVVYFKNRRILYGGCMIKALTAGTPGFIGDADMAAWPVSVQKVLDRFPQTRLVVPGHGAAGDLALLTHTIRVCKHASPQ
jgi:glyoxylase-like metal-dependent hydrolase (beta-lactamase superfamily II)